MARSLISSFACLRFASHWILSSSSSSSFTKHLCTCCCFSLLCCCCLIPFEPVSQFSAFELSFCFALYVGIEETYIVCLSRNWYLLFGQENEESQESQICILHRKKSQNLRFKFESQFKSKTHSFNKQANDSICFQVGAKYESKQSNIAAGKFLFAYLLLFFGIGLDWIGFE